MPRGGNDIWVNATDDMGGHNSTALSVRYGPSVDDGGEGPGGRLVALGGWLAVLLVLVVVLLFMMRDGGSRPTGPGGDGPDQEADGSEE